VIKSYGAMPKMKITKLDVTGAASAGFAKAAARDGIVLQTDDPV